MTMNQIFWQTLTWQTVAVSFFSPKLKYDLQDIVDELTSGVIGGPSTYSPESFQEGRQRLMAILPKSQGYIYLIFLPKGFTNRNIQLMFWFKMIQICINTCYILKMRLLDLNVSTWLSMHISYVRN